MTFTTDYAASARRHLEAGVLLRDRKPDVAGYLFGIAAECAIKAMMDEANVRPKRPGVRSADRVPLPAGTFSDAPWDESVSDQDALINDQWKMREPVSILDAQAQSISLAGSTLSSGLCRRFWRFFGVRRRNRRR
jgi:hypothetical protein